MSDDAKTYTLAEVREWQQNAFVQGAEWCRARHGQVGDYDVVMRKAMVEYPLPKKLREVKIGPYTYRARCGVVEYSSNCMAEWCPIREVSVAYVSTIADLIAHPYEEDR